MLGLPTTLRAMEPIHGRQGEVVGWLEEGRIRDLQGSVIAHIQRRGNVNTQQGLSLIHILRCQRPTHRHSRQVNVNMNQI